MGIKKRAYANKAEWEESLMSSHEYVSVQRVGLPRLEVGTIWWLASARWSTVLHHA